MNIFPASQFPMACKAVCIRPGDAWPLNNEQGICWLNLLHGGHSILEKTFPTDSHATLFGGRRVMWAMVHVAGCEYPGSFDGSFFNGVIYVVADIELRLRFSPENRNSTSAAHGGKGTAHGMFSATEAPLTATGAPECATQNT